MRELVSCKYCKKERLACLFMKMTGYKTPLCNYCYTQAIKGKKLKNGKWRGFRFSETPEAKKMYKERHLSSNYSKKKKLYSPLNKEQREKVNIILSNSFWPDDYLPN